MPTVIIPQIGPVEYVSKALSPGIKGKSVIGDYDAPILITEELSPGTKLEYVVAHEVGHRLTLAMLANAVDEMPEFFKGVPRDRPTAGLVKYFLLLGLKKEDLRPLHPGTLSSLDSIWAENLAGRYTSEDIAREFVAEVYANWATDRGHIPPALAKRFKALTLSKNTLLGLKSREAAFYDVEDTTDYRRTVLLLLSIGVAVLILS